MRTRRYCILTWLLLAGTCGVAAEESKTVVGPSNAMLADGADALMARDAERGVSLTLRGLSFPTNKRDERSAWANLCAGYVMLENPREAVSWCDKAIEADPDHWRAYNNRAIAYIQLGRLEEAAADIERVESLRPNAGTLKTVKAMLLHETDPVQPTVTIDDRRQKPTH